MAEKRKAGRPPKRRVIKPKVSEEVKTEAKAEEVKQVEAKKDELFPDRQPIYGEQYYDPGDSTALVRDGKDYVPEDHGYVARFMSPEQIKIMGMRGYTPVPVEPGIRIKGHPLTQQEIGNAGDAGNGVYLRLQQNTNAQKELCADELAEMTGGKSRYVKLSSSILCMCPKELADNRKGFAKEVSNNSLRRSLVQAAEEAQNELGSDTRKFGKFTVNTKAGRYEMDKKTKSPKKIWSVPANIK
jgi:hypothetical protein